MSSETRNIWYQNPLVTRDGGAHGCPVCSYDALGNVLSSTDARGFTTVFDRNELGGVYRVTSPAPYHYKVETYYDANRNVVRVDTEDKQVAYESGDPTDPFGRNRRIVSVTTQTRHFWYRCFHGDKETFHMAWRKLGREYAMPARAIQDRDGVICQHDFEGRRAFQHRSGHKWTLMGDNRRIGGLLFEDECRAALDALDRAWQGRRLRRYRDETATAEQRERARSLCAGRWASGHYDCGSVYTLADPNRARNWA
jgi:YD repeat-containing protein